MDPHVAEVLLFERRWAARIRAAGKAEAQHGLNELQATILRELLAPGTGNPGWLAWRLGTDPAQISRSLRALEAAGWLTTMESLRDRRMRDIDLTESGVVLAERLVRGDRGRVRERLDSLPRREVEARDEATNLLDRMRERTRPILRAMPARPPAFVAQRADRSFTFALPIAAREAFALFTPEGEKSWVEGWRPEYLHPPSGRIEQGMVFRTAAQGEATIWCVGRYESEAMRVEYIRCTPGSRIATVSVRCAERGAARCEVTVRYIYTGLSPEGNEWIRAMDEARYAEEIGAWRTSIEAMLAARDQ
jgi:DNA-binding MarR family transcriptional regulator